MFRRLMVALALLLFFFHSLPLQNLMLAAGQSAAPSSEQRKTSEPYTGDLSIFDSPGRDERLQINRVMDILGIVPGKSVADIGAGSGWFTVRAARRVGGGGMVYAVDINPEAIRYVGERAQKEKLAECENDPEQGRRSAAASEFGGRGVVAEDVSRSGAAGGVAAEPARGAASGRQGRESSTATETAKITELGATW